MTEVPVMPRAESPGPATRTTHFENESSRRFNKDVSKPAEFGSRKRWTFGIMEDRQTQEVPGLQHEQARGRSGRRGSIPGEQDRRRSASDTKKTADGQIILEPQPDDSTNDPLNWPAWRRDAALVSLGFYCMLGGGMTPILAAGFNQVAQTLHISYSDVARTTGLYMMGLGIGSVVFSPTAILYGKRPVYLLGAMLFIVSSIWCALSPNYANLVTARVFQGIAVSPVECLPSATIAEIFFLHERAFRVGIYTLLLLGGKNLIPLVSAAIIQGLNWRWVFWIVAIVVGFAGILLFLFVPETFWDRTPRPKALTRKSTSKLRRLSTSRTTLVQSMQPVREQRASESRINVACAPLSAPQSTTVQGRAKPGGDICLDGATREKPSMVLDLSNNFPHALPTTTSNVPFTEHDPNLPHLHNLNSPYYLELEKSDNFFDHHPTKDIAGQQSLEGRIQGAPRVDTDEAEKQQSTLSIPVIPRASSRSPSSNYTTVLRQQPTKPWTQTLKPWNGRLNKASWWRAAIRPGILYAYPSVLWSALVYSLSVGWLIVLSESVSRIYSNRESYNFNSLQIGLVYMSPFLGGILGSAVAGKVSDVVVRWMARRNDGIYEPEFRLIMAIPIAISTTIGLMGFGWSAEERDAWIVPTLFFGVISFGCSLGSTTSITFCVDSYREYAGEALVTLNFSKNIFHGLIWSLFFPEWLEHDGSKTVFITIGGIQLACMLFTIPMYMFGKRARMWTVRKNMMGRF